MKSGNLAEQFTEVKTNIDSMGGFWSQYNGNSIGRAINYLYHICGLNVAENAVFGNKTVSLHSQPFATINWSKGYPHFTFIGSNAEHYTNQQTHLLKPQ